MRTSPDTFPYVLDETFDSMRATEMAPALLGKLLCRRYLSPEGVETIFRHRITETECYFGESDTACHASHGKTARNRIMYEAGGVAYIYLCYGIHSLLNVVSGEKDFPEAVLIRGVEGYNGPGKLTRGMKIDGSLNGTSLLSADCLWIEDDGCVPAYQTARRVGIDYASEPYKSIPWRYILKNN